MVISRPVHLSTTLWHKVLQPLLTGLIRGRVNEQSRYFKHFPPYINPQKWIWVWIATVKAKRFVNTVHRVFWRTDYFTYLCISNIPFGIQTILLELICYRAQGWWKMFPSCPSSPLQHFTHLGLMWRFLFS